MGISMQVLDPSAPSEIRDRTKVERLNWYALQTHARQIEAIQTLVDEKLRVCSHSFLQIGQRVRIRNGALAGIEGIVVSRNGDEHFVVSVDAIERSLAVRIQGYDVEPA